MRACVIEAQNFHIPYIANNMRPDDANEVWAASRKTPVLALKASLILSQYAKTIMVDDEPAAMFGVSDLNRLTGKGVPWLLGTSKIERVSYRFLKGSKVYLKDMLSGFSCLENWVDARNTVSIQWLKWLGFDMMPSEPYGHFGLPFHRFYMENKNV